ncbi:hypothetical protein D3C86_1050950 [compost metagenome]
MQSILHSLATMVPYITGLNVYGKKISGLISLIKLYNLRIYLRSDIIETLLPFSAFSHTVTFISLSFSLTCCCEILGVKTYTSFFLISSSMSLPRKSSKVRDESQAINTFFLFSVMTTDIKKVVKPQGHLTYSQMALWLGILFISIYYNVAPAPFVTIEGTSAAALSTDLYS